MEIQELRPSLIIGLGGTGKIILTRLRANLEKRFGDVPRQRIRLLELDIDPATEVARVDGGETRLREDELVNLGDVPLEEIRNQMVRGRYRELQPWFDPSVTAVERTLLRAAHQVRQAGRVAFYWHLGSGPQSRYLYKRFRDTIDELLDLYKRDMSRNATITIYVVSSLCGGTGSGILLDVGFVLQQVLGARRDYATLVGIFTTPLFYRAAPQFPLQANTWAAAQELNYFMTTPEKERKFEHITYLPGVDVRVIPAIGKPYDYVYLVDARLEDGSTLFSMEAGARAITNALALLTTSRIGDDAASRIADVAALRDMAAGTVFSSLASASLVFPADEIVSWCAAKGAQEIVERKLLVSPTEEQTKDLNDRLEDFLHQTVWTANDIWTRLSRDERERPVASRLAEDPRLTRGVLEALPRQGLYEAVRDRANQALPELKTRALERVQNSRQAEEEKFVTQLDAWVKELVNDETRGLAYALEFLKRLEGRLEDVRRNAEAGLYQAEQSRRGAESAVAEAERVFRDRVRRAGRFFGGDPRGARDDYLRTAQALLDRIVDYRAWEETRNLVASAQKAAETKRRQAEDTLNTFRELTTGWLPQTQRDARQDIENMDRVRERPVLLGPPGREREVLESNLSEIYAEYSPRALEELRRNLYGSREQPARVGDLLGLAPKELQDRLLEWAKEAFRSIYQVRLEDWISRMKEKPREEGGKTASEYLLETFGYASYMWQASAGVARAEEHFAQVNAVIGLEDREHSIYSGTYAAEILSPVISGEGTSLVSTGDPHRLTILKMGHGLRLQDFAWIKEYRNAYQERIKRLIPVHIFPEFNLNPDGKGKERREVFARALAYGLVQIVEDPLGKKPPRFEVGGRALSDKGLFDALWVFVQERDLVNQVIQAVEDHERHSSREQILKELGSFANNFANRVAEGERWLAEILQDDVRPGS